MAFDKDEVRQRLLAWEDVLKRYRLPAWDELPTLPLYMDQVIYLLNEYLALFPEEEREARQVTPAMVNNYVKLKIIPPPVKKRYTQVHLAYLIIVCILKQMMNTGEIRKLTPPDMEEADVQAMYSAFVEIFECSIQEHIEEVRRAAEPVLSGEETPAAHLIFHIAAGANLSRLLIEQLIQLEQEKQAPVPEK